MINYNNNLNKNHIFKTININLFYNKFNLELLVNNIIVYFKKYHKTNNKNKIIKGSKKYIYIK